MDYLKSVVPSQLLSERGSNLVIINPGSANIRIGLASKDTPLNIPHCIAWHTTQEPRRNVQDQLLNTQVTTTQYMEREKAYDMIASFLKIPFIDEEVGNNSYPRKMGRVDGLNPQNSRKDTSFDWTDVYKKEPSSSSALESSENKGTTSESLGQHRDANTEELGSSNHKYKKVIYGEEALKISPMAPYTLHRPIRRGHLNISLHYPMQQVLEDVHAIWDFILTEKLHIPLHERHKYAAMLVLPETFDNRALLCIRLYAILTLLGLLLRLFNEFGVDGGPAAKDLSPKFNVFKKNLSAKLGVAIPEIDVRHLAAGVVAMKGLGGLLFVLNSSFGATLLLLQLAITTPLIYDFYNYSPENAKFGILLNEFLQHAALFGALLFFIGMKNSIPKRQVKKKAAPKTKTG
ncbi:hypothetical protein C1H46_013271 [Malus baccata]|uniref:Uncharacterized protein n=1 Tax=Malus baccata TaxID=106549 RepID=A0A540MQT1_MALBA|nr:hypothetical protein C1H46_013271 [Malus baccata]